MLQTEPRTTCPKHRKLETQVRPPGPDALRSLSPDDAKTLKRVLTEPVEYFAHDLMDSPAAEQWLAQPVPDRDTGPNGKRLKADDSGVYRLVTGEEPPVKLDREQHLFLRFNYCRRQVFELLQTYAGKRLPARAIPTLLKWDQAAQDSRAQIVRENIGLVLAMAKRTRIHGVDLSDLISEGNLALLRAVNKFDCSRGFRLSTYACRAILKSFSRVASRASRYRGYFPTEFDPALEKSDHLERRRRAIREHCVDELRNILEENLGLLSDVERKVIRARFALDDIPGHRPGKGQTLEQVGEQIGVTKERVRQIQNKALVKLRSLLDRAVLA